MFQSKEHQRRFEERLAEFEETHGLVCSDPFFHAMFYLVNSDFLNGKFEKLFEEDFNSGKRYINLHKFSSIDMSSTQKFMMSFALSIYFNFECDYNFAYSFYQLDRDNQDLITNALSFLKH